MVLRTRSMYKKATDLFPLNVTVVHNFLVNIFSPCFAVEDLVQSIAWYSETVSTKKKIIIIFF